MIPFAATWSTSVCSSPFLRRSCRSSSTCMRQPTSAPESRTRRSVRRRSASAGSACATRSTGLAGNTTRPTLRIAWSLRAGAALEAALRALQQAEQRYEQDQRQMRSEAQRRIPLELRTQFASVGQALPGLWPMLPMATRKELLAVSCRTKVVLKRLPTLEQLPGAHHLARRSLHRQGAGRAASIVALAIRDPGAAGPAGDGAGGTRVQRRPDRRAADRSRISARPDAITCARRL